MTIDSRATRAIKVSMNKRFRNKNSVNLMIAKIISQFSHASILERGSIFQYANSGFYVVNHIKSPFFVSITRVPPLELMMTRWGAIVYSPNWSKASRFYWKKVFDPFCPRPYLKQRDRRIYFKKPL